MTDQERYIENESIIQSNFQYLASGKITDIQTRLDLILESIELTHENMEIENKQKELLSFSLN